MKQLSLLAIVLSFIGLSARAATLGGTVTNASLSSPVSGQKIYCYDSLSMWTDSATTNSSGVYTFTLPSSTTTGHQLLVWTTACGAFHRNVHTYAGSNITSNFSVCGSTSTYRLHGTVSLGSTTNNGLATLYVIRKQYDSLIMDTVLTAIDSTVTAASGGNYNFNYTAIPYGTLLLKAALKSSHPSYSSFLPTYYSSSLNWSGATKLTASNFAPANTTNITMIGGTNPGGPGFIGGSVLVGANKTTAIGDPLSNKVLLLTNAAGQAVAYTYSDASGQFQFNNLPLGNYLLFGDAWGKTNPPLSIALTSSKNSITDVVFEENNKTFKGHIGNVSVAGSPKLGLLSAYPNPVTDYVQIRGLDQITGSKTIILSDVRGAVLDRQTVETGSVAKIQTSQLASGIYLIQVQCSEGTASFKLVK